MRRTDRILLAIVLGLGAIDATRPAARADLTIYMSTGLLNRIDQVTPPDPRSQFAALPLSLPEGVVFDNLGNLFVAGAQDVFKITPGGVVSTFATLPFSAGGYGIAIDTAANLYVADSFLGQISKITPGGTVSLFADSIQSPTGLTFDAASNLYVSSLGTIKKINPDGSMVSTYVTLPTGFNNNYGLAFDAAGYLYSADAAQATIFKIAPGGGSISSFGAISSGAIGLAFDSRGNLYAAEYSANRIEVIRPNGDTSLFADQLDNPRFLAIRHSAVPEPSSWVLLAAGLASILAYRRLHAPARRANGAAADLRRSPLHEIPKSS